jgi:hypothetical protein
MDREPSAAVVVASRARALPLCPPVRTRVPVPLSNEGSVFKAAAGDRTGTSMVFPVLGSVVTTPSGDVSVHV